MLDELIKELQSNPQAKENFMKVLNSKAPEVAKDVEVGKNEIDDESSNNEIPQNENENEKINETEQQKQGDENNQNETPNAEGQQESPLPQNESEINNAPPATGENAELPLTAQPMQPDNNVLNTILSKVDEYGEIIKKLDLGNLARVMLLMNDKLDDMNGEMFLGVPKKVDFNQNVKLPDEVAGQEQQNQKQDESSNSDDEKNKGV